MLLIDSCVVKAQLGMGTADAVVCSTVHATYLSPLSRISKIPSFVLPTAQNPKIIIY